MQSSQDDISWWEVQYQSFSHTHNRTRDKITVLRSRDIDCNGVHIDVASVHIDIASVDDNEGFHGKYNNSNSLENDPDMKMSQLFLYEEPESSVRHRSSCLEFEVISF